jgi:predicted kinase
MKESQSGRIIIVSGLPGSGKSYFAEKLAAQLGAVYLSSDQIRNVLQARGKYALEDKMMVYQYMADLTSRHLEKKKTVVADATFYHHSMRDLFSGVAAEQQGRITFILVKTSEDLSRQRLAKPRVDSEADFDVYESLKSKFEPYKTPHLELYSGTDNILEMLSAASIYLDNDRA